MLSSITYIKRGRVAIICIVNFMLHLHQTIKMPCIITMIKINTHLKKWKKIWGIVDHCLYYPHLATKLIFFMKLRITIPSFGIGSCCYIRKKIWRGFWRKFNRKEKKNLNFMIHQKKHQHLWIQLSSLKQIRNWTERTLLNEFLKQFKYNFFSFLFVKRE